MSTDGRTISVFGATGSVGASTLDLVRRADGAMRIDTLTANTSVNDLAALAREFDAHHVVIGDAASYGALKDALSNTGTTIAAGAEALCEAAQRPVDLVMAAIVGAAGLAPTIAAVRNQPLVALANKETLVCAGAFVIAEAARCRCLLIPVDSEHSALLQALGGPAFLENRDLSQVAELIITASGGPFLDLGAAELARVTPEQAVAHPTWSMGAKISVDSATLMNKALELIEAKHLFSVPAGRLRAVVHPQSIIHGLVRYRDGSVVAQMANPDMRAPIAFALGWPDRTPTPVKPLDLAEIGTLSFHEPDTERFPAMRLARQILESDGGAATICNAANEVAVAAFLDRRIGFADIVAIVERTVAELDGFAVPAPAGLEDAEALDTEARGVAARFAATDVSRIAG